MSIIIAPKAHLRGLQQRWDLKSQIFHPYIYISNFGKFSTVRPIEPPIHPLAAPKMRCGMCLPTHKALRNRFLERFYVKDFFIQHPESKIFEESHIFKIFKFSITFFPETEELTVVMFVGLRRSQCPAGLFLVII